MNRYLGIGSRLTLSILWDASRAVVPWKQYRVFWNTICLHTTSEKPNAAQNTSAIPTSRPCSRCGLDAILTMTKGTSPMLVKLQTVDYLIYAELDKAERVTHLASKNRIRPQTCYAILHEIEARGDYEVSWGLADDGYSDTVRITRTARRNKI